MMELLLSGNKGVLALIGLLALVIYWQMFDLLQELLLNRQRLNASQIRQCQLRSRQLSGWVGALPLLGLLGTVGGLFDSFSGLANGDQRILTSGIAEALLTTQLGLSSALPALLLLVTCQRRCERLLQEAICTDLQ